MKGYTEGFRSTKGKENVNVIKLYIFFLFNKEDPAGELETMGKLT